MRQQRVTEVIDKRGMGMDVVEVVEEERMSDWKREQWNRQARVKRAAAAAPPEERAPVLFVSSLDAGATHATHFRTRTFCSRPRFIQKLHQIRSKEARTIRAARSAQTRKASPNNSVSRPPENSSRPCIPVVCYAGHGIKVDLNPSIPQSVVVTPTLAAKVRKRRSPYLFHTRPFSC
ncbi:hypothetical protein An02g01230 [Aspergillus niger]|uniref:Uncharacterized protein n=2 Tax=Aspergillus niger TaxID=5061 RepID=A2QBU2_ASPNC|nr:hypothetical protein An02g01230 [Aspergillus niger]CAK96339.1 hypothetical protein An02g01230 [Aspergillus niger]